MSNVRWELSIQGAHRQGTKRDNVEDCVTKQPVIDALHPSEIANALPLQQVDRARSTTSLSRLQAVTPFEGAYVHMRCMRRNHAKIS